MPFRKFAHRSRKQDMMLLSGWLFADLLLGLMTIFLASMPANTTKPPKLIVDPQNLSENDKHCNGIINPSMCTVTLSEDKASEVSVKWTATSDMNDNTSAIQFNASTPTLSPGQSISLTISNIPCQNGSLTIGGSNNAIPAVIMWKCRVIEKLETNSVSFNVKINDIPGLLSDSSAEDNNIKQQLRNQPLLIGWSVGLALAYGGSGSDNNIDQAQKISAAIYRIMDSMQHEQNFTSFQRYVHYDVLILLGGDPSRVRIDVYRYQRQQIIS